MPVEGSADLIAKTAYLAVGSNMGEREVAVLSVLRHLEAANIGRNLRMSSLYETEPVGCGPMRPFVNAVVEVQSLLCPGDLLKRLQDLERTMGRSGGHNEPREIDVDIVAVGDERMRTPELTVPHPRYYERAFVLVPLLELNPDFRCPVTGRSGSDLLRQLAPQKVRRVSTRKTIHGHFGLTNDVY